MLPICRTVKVWSLRSQGDGSAVMNPQWSYSQHKKSTFFVTFLAATQHAASCDSTVHVWDPFVGTGVHQVIEIFTLVLSRINEIWQIKTCSASKKSLEIYIENYDSISKIWWN